MAAACTTTLCWSSNQRGSSTSSSCRTLLKLDLTKAFDSISWAFVLQVLRRTGFGGWLCILWSSTSTRVMINGALGSPIWHRKGLWQGDPLSPQFCVLAVDTLCRLDRRALNFSFLQPLHPLRQILAVPMYANDVIVLCHPSRQDLDTIKDLLSVFGVAWAGHQPSEELRHDPELLGQGY